MNLKTEYQTITCVDQLPSCSNYLQYCNSGATLNQLPINQACAFSCGVCKS